MKIKKKINENILEIFANKSRMMQVTKNDSKLKKNKKKLWKFEHHTKNICTTEHNNYILENSIHIQDQNRGLKRTNKYLIKYQKCNKKVNLIIFTRKKVNFKNNSN